MATALSKLMTQWEETVEKARLSNLERAEQIKAIHGEIIRRYEPGGPFEERGLAVLEKQKRREVGAEMQQMISSGLYGTTTAAGGGRRWEEAVGEPGRMRLEDIMMQRLSQAQLGMAGFMERIEEPYPDYATMAGLTQQASAGPAQPTYQQPAPMGGGETYGATSFQESGLLYSPESAWGLSPRGAAPTTTAPTKGTRAAGTGYAAMMEQGMRGQQVIAQKGTRREIPTPQEVGMTGAMGVLPGQVKSPTTQIDAEYKKYVADVYARGSYITSGTKKRWMKQQGY